MKHNPNTLTFAALIAAASLFGVSATVFSAESDTKSKSKAASSETKKTAPKKTESKKTESKKSDAETKNEKPMSAELRRATEVLNQLTTAQKSALTKQLNGGTKKELMSLPGIGDIIADNIIKARPLESAAHLITIDGIGEKTFADIVKSRK